MKKLIYFIIQVFLFKVNLGIIRFMDIKSIEKHILEWGYPVYRVKQIKDWVFSGKAGSFWDIKNIPYELRRKLSEDKNFFSFKKVKVFESPEKNSFKFAFELKDLYVIETSIFKNSQNEWVVCLSSQAGCAVRCVFCASGKKGLKRNLNYEEIFDQILFSRYFLVSKNTGDVRRVVYMGMGEPFMNYENLCESIKMINKLLNIGKRNISVSTFGYLPRIMDFARDFPQVNLAVSVHSAQESVRNMLVPMASKYPLSKLAKALSDYINITSRKVFIEYVLLNGINTGIKDAYRLKDFLKSVADLKYFTVNLIPYNYVSNRFKSPSCKNILRFQNLLLSLGIETTVRKSYASDVKGACGQLSLRFCKNNGKINSGWAVEDLNL
ncbi:MAG: 23S rRNA (adenine(2503)-C(2))-methyltransferase RlmN [Elusimicrobiales bacterium]